MNASKRSTLLVLAILPILLFGLSGCAKPKAKLEAGPGSASLEAPDTLLTALTIVNEGTEAAEDVEISSLSIAGTKLTLPTALPSSLGSIAPDGHTALNANFIGPAAKPDMDYDLIVTGTFHEHGHRFRFSVEKTLRTLPASPGSGKANSGSVPSVQVTGAPYPEQKPSFGAEVNEGGHARPVPTGPHRTLAPSKDSSVKPVPNGPGGGGSASISFPINAPVGINSSTVAEPSGASGGGLIFETANWYASYSADGGATFIKLSPTTIFPNGVDGGFCCDQIVQYAPSIDRFIWVMQYGASKPSPNPKTTPTYGPNLYRIAFASPATIKSSKGTSWSYFDISSTAVLGATSTSWLDYPDASLGDNSFYLSADDVNNGGHVIVRVPLSDIKAGGTINFAYTASSDSAAAYGGHLSQNTRDEAFWAGHISNSKIRVFNWPESSANYGWRDIAIGSWPQTNSSNPMTSTTPDGQNWVAGSNGFPGNAILGLARSSDTADFKRINRIYLAWDGAIGNGFKQPQVQWVALDRNNDFALVSQQQVWNPGYAYAYPAFAVNSHNEIGMSLEWGGGGNYENHVAGFWGDYVVYETTNSGIGTGRFGDYVTIRQNTADPSKFDAFGYGLNKTTPPSGTIADVHYIIFSR